MQRFIVSAGFFLLVLLPVSAQPAALPAPVALTLTDALERARQASPAVVAARMRIDEARGRVTGASILFPANPTVDLAAGRRSGDTSTTDYGIELAQDLELPRRRRARIAAAEAGVAIEQQTARDAERETLILVTGTFLRAVEARERAEAAAASSHLAIEALRIAERRYETGDVARLDVNLARTAVARADADLHAAQAALTGHAMQLQLLLDMTAPVMPQGTLHESLAEPRDDLITRATDRPDVRMLDAEIAGAEAEQRLARTLAWPEVGLRASYEREEGDRIVMGGVGLSLPFFNRGQEASAITSARLARLHVERVALARRIEAEVRGSIARYEALRETTTAYEQTVMPLIEENEKLALESYEVGQIGLADLLLVRREALDARRSLIDQLIETRLAELALNARAGVWPGVSK